MHVRKRKRPSGQALPVTTEEREELERVAKSRTEPHRRVVRAQVLLGYLAGESVRSLTTRLPLSQPSVDLCINKALTTGALTALDDLPRAGRPARIPAEDKLWVVELACRKPTDLGHPEELWTRASLAQHVREHCVAEGHPSLHRVQKGEVQRILAAHAVQPHKIQYYLERRDPDFEAKRAFLLSVYQEVDLQQERLRTGQAVENTVTLSVDEKPGVQALANTAPDRRPVPGTHPTLARDHEYVRLGTLSLLTALDLRDGHVHGLVRPRHRSAEFVELLQLVDAQYPIDWRIRIILDNHSAHVSKETQRYLATRPGRFEFVFTPKHASWLNIVESFFSKMSRQVLRAIRVNSPEEMSRRIEQYWADLNAHPVVFRWHYQIEDVEGLTAAMRQS